ncbi:MAG: hypothetical protein ACRD2E_06590 [Terriglobales bacterium]
MKHPAKVRWISIAAIAACAVAVAFYLWAPGRTPEGQKPLLTLTPGNLATFTTSFAAAGAGPRVVLLLSPT